MNCSFRRSRSPRESRLDVHSLAVDRRDLFSDSCCNELKALSEQTYSGGLLRLKRTVIASMTSVELAVDTEHERLPGGVPLQ